eukprot:gene36294-biopygen864
MINAMPHVTALAYAAPRELLIGRKLDFKRDVCFEFGDYVQARVPNLVKNSLSPRSQGGVALAPVGNSIVSIWVMWDKFVCLPINSLKASQSLTFRYRDIEIPINLELEPFDEEYAETASEANTVSLDAANYEDETFDFDADGDTITMEDIQLDDAKGVWKPVDVSYLLEEEVTRIIHSSLFLKEKLTMDGEREKIKARFVVGGTNKISSPTDISSPAVRTDSVLMVAAIAAWERRTVATVDTGGVYLKADMEDPAVQVSDLLCQLDESYRPFVQIKAGVAMVSMDQYVSDFLKKEYEFSEPVHSGIVTTLGERAVDAESINQKLVTTSSAESELVTLAGAVMVAIYKKEFLEYQKYQVGPALIYQNNQSAITLARKGKSTSPWTRHVNIRYFLHDRINSGEVAYLSTDEMLAYVLTKPLQGCSYKKLRDRQLNRAAKSKRSKSECS